MINVTETLPDTPRTVLIRVSGYPTFLTGFYVKAVQKWCVHIQNESVAYLERSITHWQELPWDK